MNSIFHRTSIREFTDQKVEKEKVELILKAAMAAPSSSNQQPWEFYITENKSTLLELSQCSPYAGCAKKAPMAFVICYREDVPYVECAPLDAAAATENMLLAIDSLGLASVWLSVAPFNERVDQVIKVLSLPNGIHPFAILPCGYPIKIIPQKNRYNPNKIHFLE
ncbi:MAG: nitroreductase [Firmicutes bacterium]|nr:nitroreductase [Bacillota bacterium]